jgi:2-iminobutanoate/2-iminopropanoate deaminase
MYPEKIDFKTAPPAVGPYSQGIRAGNLLFLSGQIPIDPETMMVETGSIDVQTRRVLGNIQSMLSEVNLSLENLIKVTIFLTDMNHFSVVNDIYTQFFKNAAPARECVEVSRLPKDVGIEISVIAMC